VEGVVALAAEEGVVVGVAEDVRYRDLESPRPVIYRPWAQAPELQLPVIVARGRSGGSLAPSEIRIVVQEVDQRVVVTKVSRLDDALSTALARPKFNLLIVGAFAGIAMLLAAFGAYAMLAAIVRQRLPELGIRLALGATPGEIRRLVIVRGLGLAVVGLVSGILVSLGLSRLLASLLYGVSAVDPLTFMASFTTMFGIATLACWRPATMASRVDPLQVLRME